MARAIDRDPEAWATAHPDDVDAQAAAAYACDRAGREAQALRYYQRAFELGGPADDRAGFLLGFGSTLRNVGRVDDAVAVLGEAVLAHPDHAALRAFLALALGSAGHHALALATMLDAGLTASPTALESVSPGAGRVPARAAGGGGGAGYARPSHARSAWPRASGSSTPSPVDASPCQSEPPVAVSFRSSATRSQRPRSAAS